MQVFDNFRCPKMNESQEGQKCIDTEERCTQPSLMPGGCVVKDCF